MQNNSNVPGSHDKGKTNGNGKWMAKAAASEAGEQLTNLTESARDVYERALQSGGDLVTRANKRAGEVVREYPVQATIGGLVLGFLIGVTMFRRRD